MLGSEVLMFLFLLLAFVLGPFADVLTGSGSFRHTETFYYSLCSRQLH